jgi:hypothetical protein
MEHPSNIRPVCEHHAAKPDPQYFEKPFDWFFGKFCKLRFPTGRMDSPMYESMWVKVERVQDHDGKPMLLGELNNDPMYVAEYKCGDGVLFDRNEVCDVLEAK